jgi:transposase InsO family protein
MCRLLVVSATGYYASRGRGPSPKALSDQALLESIRAIHARFAGSYGAPRVDAQLLHQGVQVGRKRVPRLMREAGLRGVSRRCCLCTTRRDGNARPSPDLVQRQFRSPAPDRLCVADIRVLQQRGRMPVSDEEGGTVLGDGCAARNQAHALVDALRHEHAVERIGVMGWKFANAARMPAGDSQLREAHRVQRTLQLPQVDLDAAECLPDRDLPYRRSADEHGVLGVPDQGAGIAL